MERIVIKNVSKKFNIEFEQSQTVLSKFLSIFSGQKSTKTIWANKNISLTIPAGKIIGLIGPNGCGKSTLLRIIAGIYAPDKGEVIVKGKIISFLGWYLGMKDRLTMSENIYLLCSLFGLSNKEIKKNFKNIVDFSELKQYTDTKLYKFSSGMLLRLAFSIAIHCNPNILLLDEVFEVGDEKFKSKSAKKIKELTHKGGTVIIVSHENQLINKYCEEVISMNQGEVIKIKKNKIQ